MCHWNSTSYDSTNVLIFLVQAHIRDQQHVLFFIGLLLGALIMMEIFCLYTSDKIRNMSQHPDPNDVTDISSDFDNNQLDDMTASAEAAKPDVFENDDSFTDKMVDCPTTEDDILSMIEELKHDLSEMSNLVHHLAGGTGLEEGDSGFRYKDGHSGKFCASADSDADVKPSFLRGLEISVEERNRKSSDESRTISLKSCIVNGNDSAKSASGSDSSTETLFSLPNEINYLVLDEMERDYLDEMEKIGISITDRVIKHYKKHAVKYSTSFEIKDNRFGGSDESVGKESQQTAGAPTTASSAPKHDAPAEKLESPTITRFKQLCADIVNASKDLPTDLVCEPLTEGSFSPRMENEELNICAIKFLGNSQDVNRQESSKTSEIEKEASQTRDVRDTAFLENESMYETGGVFENANGEQQTVANTRKNINEMKQNNERHDISKMEQIDSECVTREENEGCDDFSSRNKMILDWELRADVPVEFLYACSPHL